MDFKTAMEHYQAGNPTEEERRLVEEELEKSQLIAEHLDSQWEPDPAAETAPKAEMKQLRRSLRKRNALIVCTSLLLAAVLLFGTVQVAIPALEQLYWDPTTVSYGTEAGTDLDMTLAAYTDLFCPSIDVTGTKVTHTGFASYSIAIQYWNYALNEPVEYCYGTLEKGELFIPDGIWENAYGDKVGALWMTDTTNNAVNRQHFTEKLAQLPEYIQVGAYITFTEDKSLQDVLDFTNQITEGNIDRINQTARLWLAIRHSDNMGNETRCGLSFCTSTDSYPEANEIYPAFNHWQAYSELGLLSSSTSRDSEVLETHFKTLLRYLDDQMKNGTGIPAPALPTGEENPDFYADTLAYVEENGVMAYGCYVSASPQSLLEIMEREDVLIVIPTEGWLNI